MVGGYSFPFGGYPILQRTDFSPLADLFAILADFLSWMADSPPLLADIPFHRGPIFPPGGFVPDFGGFSSMVGGFPSPFGGYPVPVRANISFMAKDSPPDLTENQFYTPKSFQTKKRSGKLTDFHSAFHLFLNRYGRKKFFI
jgi:hypothetical protein